MPRRLLASAVIAFTSALLCWSFLSHFQQGGADFQWAIRAARYLLAGNNPYDIPQQQYPPPAAFFGIPFLAMSGEIAAAVFFGLSSGVLAFGLTEKGWYRLLIFLAYPYWAALMTAQWSPLIASAAFFWWLLPLVLVKPQVALPVAITNLNWRGVLLLFGVLVASLVLMPAWYSAWFHQLGNYRYFIPILVAPGFFLLLAAFQVREKDGRLLLLASVLPQRWFYDTFILWLIPKSRREIVWTVGASWIAGVWRWYHFPTGPHEVGRWSVLSMYLPMLLVVLFRNERVRARLHLRSPKIP